MGKSTLAFVLISLVLCNFCGKDFISINRHLWRCKSKHGKNSQHSSHNDGVANDNVNSDENDSRDDVTFQSVDSAVANPESIICACGKVCKGLVGLRMHQRTCKVIRSLSDNNTMQQVVPEVNETARGMIETSGINEHPLLKDGINLPKSPEEWNIANSWFMTSFPVAGITSANTNDCAKNLNDVVYNYFRETFGTVNKDDDSTKLYKEKYKSHSKNALKKALKTLKVNLNPDAKEVQFVARLLRSKIDNSKNNHEHSIDHDFEVSRNFWNYVKTFIEKPTRTVTSFTKSVCENYFKNVFTPSSNRTFVFPDWIPKFKEPSHQFDLSPPTYEQVTRIIKRMKAKGSPCPLDKISIICFKRCPYLRTYVAALCSEIFKSGNVPDSWKRAVTILIYKKGPTDNPENFRPITLECVCLKIFTTILRDKIGSYLRKNEFIETHIQKGFVEGMSGTFEHLSHLTYTMREAKKKQRSLYITLIDLRNAFGLVNHNLITSTLEFHHVPPQIRDLVKHMYTNFYTAIATDSYVTDFIQVGNGVLQGDCLSPLLFNMIINTFIQRIKDKQFENIGYKFMNYLSPRHWYQFADDAAVITSMESHNQILLNEFSRWCTWANLSIRLDKCHSFGMAKVKTSSKQVLPKMYINNTLIAPVKMTESFLYLGKYFDFNMSSEQHKASLTEKLKDMMHTVDQLPLHPKNKINVYSRYILPKLSWDLTVSDINETWVKQVLDPMLASHLRHWLEIPISGTLDILLLPKEKFGIGLTTVSGRYMQCQVTLRNCLKNSRNADIRKIHAQTSVGPNIRVDSVKSTKEMIKDLRLEKEMDVSKLTTQSLVVKAIWSDTLKEMRSTWHKVLQILPKNIYSFCLRYLNNTLANGTNLLKWGRTESSLCPACNSPQTLGHVVSGCKVHLNERRYNYRHDSILLNIVRSVSHLANVKIYSDLPGHGYPSPCIITGVSYRPDIIIEILNKLFVIELTAGFETNIVKNTEYKGTRYRTIISDLSLCYEIEYLNLSMGALGTFGHSCKKFKKMLTEIGLGKQEISYLINKIINVTIRTTYFIFCKRNSAWEHPELLAW